MTRADLMPALGFGLGAVAAWYWRLSPALIAFCAVACVGWLLIGRERVDE